MSIDRLAWAVAFNVTGAVGDSAASTRRGKRCYLDYWAGSTPWTSVWSSLTVPPTDGAGGACRGSLVELARSVACERRDDWQHPAARPLDAELAHAAFVALYEREQGKVTAYIAAQFHRRAGNPADIAIEAWSRVFLDYWSASAHKRVLGTSAISSLVCGTAYYIGCDALRREHVPLEDAPDAARLGNSLAAAGPGEQLMTAELERHVKRCREELSIRQQVAARLAWDYELRQVDVARRLGVSAPAVSQLLENARKVMRHCLKRNGLIGEGMALTRLRRSAKPSP